MKTARNIFIMTLVVVFIAFLISGLFAGLILKLYERADEVKKQYEDWSQYQQTQIQTEFEKIIEEIERSQNK